MGIAVEKKKKGARSAVPLFYLIFPKDRRKEGEGGKKRPDPCSMKFQLEGEKERTDL